MKQFNTKLIDYAIPAPANDSVLSRALAVAGTAESITVPAGAKYAVFSASADFACNPTGTAAIPTDVTDGTGSFVNPLIWEVTGVTTLSVVGFANDTYVSVAFYKA